MTLRRKDTRKIVVDDVSYRWAVSPDDEPGVAIIVENWVRPARRLVTWVPHRRSITPKLVRSAILDGLAEGWVPVGRGPDFVRRVR